jgi:hypothetical protein
VCVRVCVEISKNKRTSLCISSVSTLQCLISLI